MMRSQNLLTPLLEAVESRLRGIIPLKKSAPHTTLFEATRHCLLAPAKRLRPLLTLAVLRDFDCPVKYGIDPACAIEMVHTYSLIHDDLPCMDDDSFRRGKPSLHTIYGEAQAILSGDYLCTYAFEVLARSPYLSPEKKIALIKILTSRGGSEGMIGGQCIDIEQKPKPVDTKTLEWIFEKKTAALLAASLEFGGLIADLDDGDQKHLKRAGQLLGLGYQYSDDYFDREQDLCQVDPLSNKWKGHREKALLHYTKALETLKKVSIPLPRTTYLFTQCMNKVEKGSCHISKSAFRSNGV